MISRTQMLWLAALVLGDALAGAVCYGFLPSRSPVHWNFEGQIDRYGAPWEVALALPIGATTTVGLLLGLARIPQVGTALARSGPIFGRMLIAVVGLMVLLHALLLMAAFGRSIDVPMGGLVIVGLAEIVLGNWTSKLRRNKLAGIRTRWTLKSDVVWERTNRCGARIQVAHGMAVLLAALVLPVWAALIVLLGGLAALVIWSEVYSRSLYLEVGEDKPAT